MTGGRCGHALRVVMAALLVGAVGCTGAMAPRAQAAHDLRSMRDAQELRRGELVLETIAETREGALLSVAEGDTLRTGDKLWFRIRTEGPVYVYVIQISPDGSAELLYPERGDVLLPAGEAQRVPTDPRQHFVLDERPGREHVLLIAARTRLGEADALLANLVQVVKDKRKWPSGIPLEDETFEPPVAAAAAGDQGEIEAGPKQQPHGQTDALGLGASQRPARSRPLPRHEPHGSASMARPALAKPNGFMDLLGPNRSLERGLRLETDPASLQLVPDEAGIVVSLFWFHHEM